MVGNITIFSKVIMELPYYFLRPIPLNEGKTSRMAFPLIKNNTRLCQWVWAVRKEVTKELWQDPHKKIPAQEKK